MLLKKLFLNFYLGCAQLLSNRRGYGKKYKVINSTVNKIKTVLEDSGSNSESILDLLKCNNFEFFVIDEKEELNVIESEHFRKMLDENLTVNILCKKSKKQ